MRLATWNVNSLRARMERVEPWLAAVEPDVLCMQETKLATEDFPHMAFEALGYECVHHGEGRWNGVAVCSRLGLEDTAAGFADGAGEDRDARIVWATCGGVRVASVYVPNGREVGHDHYHYKLAWFGRLRAHLEAVCDPAGEVVVAGDFNVAPEDRDVWDIEVFAESTHVTEPERAAWRAVGDWGLVDVFRRRFPGVDGLYTFWDYQAGRFHKRQGMRIDHVLASESLAARAAGIVVDRNARKGAKPSDHAPLVVDFDLYERARQ
ncbi:MAG: exodeoxyribonuclease III [bacterium]|nr:exodeoxyribonuclease III [bacterium]